MAGRAGAWEWMLPASLCGRGDARSLDKDRWIYRWQVDRYIGYLPVSVGEDTVQVGRFGEIQKTVDKQELGLWLLTRS